MQSNKKVVIYFIRSYLGSPFSFTLSTDDTSDLFHYLTFGNGVLLIREEGCTGIYKERRKWLKH